MSATAEPDDAGHADLKLAFFYLPRPARFLVADLFALDAAMGDVLRTTSEELVGRIRLAWWRERLEEIDGGTVPAEPHLEGAARIAEGGAVSGADMAALADGWEMLLQPFPWDRPVIEAVAARGRTLFELAARIAGAEGEGIAASGALWALMDVARHCSDTESREALVAAAQGVSEQLSGTAREEARPLTMLGLLARRDLQRWPEAEGENAPGRAWVMIRHRLTGRL